jgi:uroporphyrinogen III methyltransferase/synthase
MSAERHGRDATKGFVSLVGAGPGDPGLITVRGRRALLEAQVVLYDHLASPALLAAVDAPGQERIHVGKADGINFSSQEDITRLLVKRAALGQRVVRLKGGDPFVFGRGAEEIEALVTAGIDFEVIPGVSSAFAAPALAGIPVTHRDFASSFTVVTGHERQDGERRVDWAALARVEGTIVVLMGVGNVGLWAPELIAGGRAAKTPVAFVRWGTLPRQEVLVTTLANAAADVAKSGLRSPAVAIVGEVVDLRERLMSFERRPLFGHVIGLTRDGDDDSHFQSLEHFGAALMNVPLTRKSMLPEGLRAIAGRISARISPASEASHPPTDEARPLTDLVFTSANGVLALRDALAQAQLDTRSLAGLTTWAVGPQTGAAMWELLALRADHVPPRATAEGLIAYTKSLIDSGLLPGPRHFLFPASARARRVLPDGLDRLGAAVTEVAVYDTVAEPTAPTRIVSAIEEGLTLLVVASPSAVESLAAALDVARIPRTRIPVAAIGPTTAQAAREAGLEVAVVPDSFNLDALAAAIAEAGAAGRLGTRRGGG